MRCLLRCPLPCAFRKAVELMNGSCLAEGRFSGACTGCRISEDRLKALCDPLHALGPHRGKIDEPAAT